MVTHKDINDFCDYESEAGITSSNASNSSLNEDQTSLFTKLKDVFGLKMNLQAEPQLAQFIKVLLKELRRFNDNADKAVTATIELKQFIVGSSEQQDSPLSALAMEMGIPLDRLLVLLKKLDLDNLTRESLKDLLSELMSEVMLDSSAKYAIKAKQSFMTTVREMIDKFGGPLLLVCLGVTAAIYAYIHRTKGTLLISAGCAAAVYVLYPETIEKFSSTLSQLISFKVPEEEIEMAKAEFSMCDIEPAIGSLLTCLFLVFAPKGKEEAFSVEFMSKLMKKATDIAKAAPSLTKIFEYITWAVQEIYNYIATTFFGADPVTLRPSGFPMFDAYFNKFKALEAQYDAKEFKLTQDNYNILMDLYNEGIELSRVLPSDNQHRSLHARLSEMLKLLRAIKEVFNASNFADEGLRQEAVGVLFMGGPGTGKSISMEYLYNAVLAAVFSYENDTRRLELLSKDPSMFLFNRQAETAYWEGYNRDKMVTFFDDLGQMKDVAGNPDGEWMNIIRAINSFQYNLHMASLNSKSNTYFRSQFVFASTNLTEFRPQSIISAEAFTRRFCLAFMVKPKEIYVSQDTKNNTPYNQRYDFSSLPTFVDENKEVRTKFNPDVQDFILYDLKNGTLTSEVYTFDQVVELVFKAYLERKSWIKETKSDLREVQRKFVGKYKKSEFPQFQAWFPDDWEVCAPKSANYVFKTRPCFSVLYSVPSKYVKLVKSYCKDDSVKALILYMMIANMMSEYSYDSCHTVTHNIGSLAQFFYTFMQKNGGKDFFELLNPDWNLPSEVYDKVKVVGDPFCEPFFMDETFYKYLELLPSENLPFEIRHNDAVYSKVFNIKPSFDFSFWSMFTGYWKDVIQATRAFYTKEYWTNEYGYWGHNFEEGCLIFMGHYQAILAGALAINLAISGVQMLVNYISPPREPASQSFTGWDRQNRLKKVMQQRPRGVSAPVAQPQMDSGLDPNGEALVKPVFEKNCYRVTTQAKDGSTAQMGYIIFVKGRKALMPYHFIEQFLEIEQKGFGDNVIDFSSYEPIYNCDKNRFSFTVTQLIEGIFDWDHQYPSFELGILNFPSSVRFHADITRKFLPLSSLNSNMRYHLRFDYFDRKSGAARASFCQGASFQKSFKMAAMQGMVTIINCVIDYPMPTDSGDCGTLVSIVDKTKGQSRILGFHIAGTVSLCMGHGQFLPRELIEEVVEGRMTWYDNYVSPGDRPSSPLAVPQGAVQTKVETDPRFRLIDSDPSPKYTPYNVSKIIASPLYGKISTVLEKPALLRPKKIDGVYIDPELKALNKYCVNHDFPVNRDLVDQAVGDYFDFMESASYFTVDRRVFTFEEAVAGLENDPDFGSIDRSTSSGYPYNTIPELKNGKKGFFGSEGPFDFDNQHAVSLKHDVMADIFDLQRGIRVPEIFCDSLKDETRPIEKVNQASTRLFSAGNIKLLIKSRMYFGAFQLWYVKNRVRNGGTLGLNPYSDEWGEMANMLHTFSDEPFIGAGDYSAFDASEVPAIHWRICDAINAWYNDEHSLVRRTLFFELAQSRHYFKGSIYEWSSSLPSGHPLTSLINCIYNQVAFRMCWISLLDSIPVAMRPERDEFHNHVVLFVHGDDNLFAVSDWAAQFFTMDFIQSAMAENLGLQYTDETKGDTIKGWRSITDVEFLKRSFRYDDKLQRWVAPWRLTALLECLNWTRKGDQALQIVFDKVQLALKELSLHEKEVFDYWHALISRMYYLKLGRHSPPSLPVGYRRCQSMVLDQPFFLY